MIVSFDRLPEQLVSGFKGGDGVVSVRAYDDDMGRILQSPARGCAMTTARR